MKEQLAQANARIKELEDRYEKEHSPTLGRGVLSYYMPFQRMLTKQQIQQICEEMQKDTQVQGILLTGSYVYGTPHEHSDLDIRAVTNDGANWVDT